MSQGRIDRATADATEDSVLASAATAIDRANNASRALLTSVQEQASLEAYSLLADLDCPEARRLSARSAQLHVGALLDRNAVPEAFAFAEGAWERERGSRHWMLGLLAGRSAWAPTLELALVQAMEHGGDPAEASQRALALAYRFRNGSGGEDTRLLEIESTKVAMTAAARAGDGQRLNAALAMVGSIVERTGSGRFLPLPTGRLLHRAGCLLSRRHPRGNIEAAEMLNLSIRLRAGKSGRETQTLGMGRGELLIARGSATEGAKLLGATLVEMRPLLPRNFESGLRMLDDRGLPLPDAA